jgi:hypothetical protein
MFPLAFKCLPNPHTQIIWHTECPSLNYKRMQNPGLYLDAVHQQMTVLQVMFTSLKVQHVIALHLDSIIIIKLPTHNPMGFGFTSPPQSSGALAVLAFAVIIALAAVTLLVVVA